MLLTKILFVFVPNPFILANVDHLMIQMWTSILLLPIIRIRIQNRYTLDNLSLINDLLFNNFRFYFFTFEHHLINYSLKYMRRVYLLLNIVIHHDSTEIFLEMLLNF
jgi:hypothetical protein